MKQFCMASLAVAALLSGGCNKSHDTAANNGATAGTAGRTAASDVSSGDRDFVKDVSAMNAAEIDVSRAAIEHASSPDVKQFAQMMVNDHTAAGNKLSSIATDASIDAPATPDDAHARLQQKLAGEKGLDVDRDYVDQMVDDHQKLVDKLESRIDRDTLSKYKATSSEKTTDKDPKVEVKAQTVLPEKSDDPVTQRINAWAAETYPVAYAHLQAVKSLKDTLKKRATD